MNPLTKKIAELVQGYQWDSGEEKKEAANIAKAITKLFEEERAATLHVLDRATRKLCVKYLKGGVMTRTGRYKKVAVARVTDDLQILHALIRNSKDIYETSL